MRALVTGANGFLGRHVVGALLARDIDVRAMVRPAAHLGHLAWTSSVEVFRADLRTSCELRSAFEDVDVLLHLAAVVSGGEDAQFAGTVVGTERLLDAMAGSACRRLVLCSSFSVYNHSAVGRTLDEDSPLLQAPAIYEGKRGAWLIDGKTGDLLSEFYGPENRDRGLCSYRDGKFPTKNDCTWSEYIDKANRM